MSNSTTARTTSIALIMLVVGMLTTAGGSYLFAEWSGPTDVPPEGNVEAPINVGSVSQQKQGGLWLLGKLLVGNDGVGVPDTLMQKVVGNIGARQYCDEEGLNCKDIADVGGGAGCPAGKVLLGSTCAPIPLCGNNQALTFTGTSFTCVPVGTCGADQIMIENRCVNIPSEATCTRNMLQCEEYAGTLIKKVNGSYQVVCLITGESCAGQ